MSWGKYLPWHVIRIKCLQSYHTCFVKLYILNRFAVHLLQCNLSLWQEPGAGNPHAAFLSTIQVFELGTWSTSRKRWSQEALIFCPHIRAHSWRKSGPSHTSSSPALWLTCLKYARVHVESGNSLSTSRMPDFFSMGPLLWSLIFRKNQTQEWKSRL